jgi:hypothetical protein
MSYNEWKEMQERSMRQHRNISIIESSPTNQGGFEDERHRFPGWKIPNWAGKEEPRSAALQDRHAKPMERQQNMLLGGSASTESLVKQQRPRSV